MTPKRREDILDALRAHPAWSRAARKVRIERQTLWRWRQEDPDFSAACEAAREQGMDVLEDALISRGERKDTTAAIFMLKSWRRERYGDRQAVDMNVSGSLSITIGQRSDGPQ